MTKARPWGTITLTPRAGGDPIVITLNDGNNSLGEVDIFAGKRPGNGNKAVAELRGWPLYAIQTWAGGHGYSYKVDGVTFYEGGVDRG